MAGFIYILRGARTFLIMEEFPINVLTKTLNLKYMHSKLDIESMKDSPMIAQSIV